MADYSFIPQVVATFLNQQRNRAQQMQLEELARQFEERENEKRRQLALLQMGLAAKQAQEELKRDWAETLARTAEAGTRRKLTELEIAAEKKRQMDEARKRLVQEQLGKLIGGGAPERTVMGTAIAGGLTLPGLRYKSPQEEEREHLQDILAIERERRQEELLDIAKKRLDMDLKEADKARQQGNSARLAEIQKDLAFDRMMVDWREWGFANRDEFLRLYPEPVQKRYANMVWVSRETGSMPRTEAKNILSTFEALDEHKAKGDLKDIMNAISKGKTPDSRIVPRLTYLWRYADKYPDIREEIVNTARRTQGLPEIEGIEPAREIGGKTATPTREQIINDAKRLKLPEEDINRVLSYYGYEPL